MSKIADYILQQKEDGLTTEQEVEDMMNDPAYREWFKKDYEEYLKSPEYKKFLDNLDQVPF